MRAERIGCVLIHFKYPLYLSEEVKDKEKKIIRAIKRRKLQLNITVIALPANPNNVLDLYDSKELLQPYYKNAEIHVIGLAGDMDDAKQLVCQIVEEIAQNAGTDYIKEYFERRMSNTPSSNA